MGKFLTHKELETMCDRFMAEHGWERGTSNNRMKTFTPDRVYSKENKWPLVIEIKPENADGPEIKKGIGQSACCLPYQVKPYLILSEKQWDTFESIIQQLPWLGIISYPISTFDKKAGYKNLAIKQKPEARVPGELTFVSFPPSPLKRKQPTTKLPAESIYNFFLESHLLGHFGTGELADILSNKFPDYKITLQSLGYTLKRLGFKKTTKDHKKGYTLSYPVIHVTTGKKRKCGG